MQGWRQAGRATPLLETDVGNVRSASARGSSANVDADDTDGGGSSLDADLHDIRLQISRSASQRDRLLVARDKLAEDLRRVEQGSLRAASGAVQNAERAAAHASQRVSAAAAALASAVAELASSQKESTRSGHVTPHFGECASASVLHPAALDEYVNADQQFLRALGAFVDKQFHGNSATRAVAHAEGIAPIGHHGAHQGPIRSRRVRFGVAGGHSIPSPADVGEEPDPTRSTAVAWLHDAHPSDLSLHGARTAHAFAVLQAELRRLRDTAPRVRWSWVQGQCARARAEAAVQYGHKQRMRAAEVTMLGSEGLRMLTLDTQRECTATEARCVALRSDAQRQCARLGELEGSSVLMGDYELKMERQRYYTGKQEQVLSWLVAQQARHRLALSLLAAQRQHAVATASVHKAASSVIEGVAAAASRRTAAMQGFASSVAASLPRVSMHTADYVGSAVAGTMAACESRGGPVVVNPDSREQRADGASDGDVGGIHSTLASLGVRTWPSVYARVRAAVDEAHSVHSRERETSALITDVDVVSGASHDLGLAARLVDSSLRDVRGALHALSHPSLAQALTDLDAVRAELSTASSSLLEAKRQRDEKMARDPVLMQGLRSMMENFHLHPHRLVREEGTLTERVGGF